MIIDQRYMCKLRLNACSSDSMSVSVGQGSVLPIESYNESYNVCYYMCYNLCQLARDRWCPLSVTKPKDRNYRQIKIVSDLCMCLCLPGAKLAYFVSTGTFGSYLYCTWAEVLSTLRRVRA